MARKGYYFAVSVLLGLAALAVASIGLTGATREAQPAYRVATVERGDLTASISATGTLNPVVTVQVGSQVSGQVREIMVDFNSRVKRDELIARIDPQSFRLRVDQASADLQATRAALRTQEAHQAGIRADWAAARISFADAEREADRNDALHRKGFISAAVRDRTHAAAEVAREKLRSAEAQLEVSQTQLVETAAKIRHSEVLLAQARVELRRTEIRAPVDGIVVKKSVEPGQTVAASLQAPELFIIAGDLSEMQVDASIDEADVSRVRLGQPAQFTVDSLPGLEFSGIVHQVRKAAKVVQNVVTYTAVIRTSNPELVLFPGMTANVRIVLSSREGVLKLPNAALRFRPAGGVADGVPDDGPLVWSVDKGRLTPVSVRTGLSDGVHTEIVGGEATRGMRVVTGIQPAEPERRALRLRF